jgi:hypothetical protein
MSGAMFSFAGFPFVFEMLYYLVKRGIRDIAPYHVFETD